MSEYKQIDEKPVWLLMKKYNGGMIEIIGVYWLEETAKRVAGSRLPSNSDAFALILEEIKLFGSMVDKA